MKFLFLLISVFLFSCHSAKKFTSAPSVEHSSTTTLTKHDSTVGIKADTASLVAKLVADSNGQISISDYITDQEEIVYSADDYFYNPAQKTAKTGRALPPKISIDKNNKLSVDCFCDTAAIALSWTSTHKADVTVKTPPPVLVEKSFTLWQAFRLWMGNFFLIILCLLTLIKIYSIFYNKNKLQ